MSLADETSVSLTISTQMVNRIRGTEPDKVLRLVETMLKRVMGTHNILTIYAFP